MPAHTSSLHTFSCKVFSLIPKRVIGLEDNSYNNFLFYLEWLNDICTARCTQTEATTQNDTNKVVMKIK